MFEFLLAVVHHNLVGFWDSSYGDFIVVVGFSIWYAVSSC